MEVYPSRTSKMRKDSMLRPPGQSVNVEASSTLRYNLGLAKALAFVTSAIHRSANRTTVLDRLRSEPLVTT